MKTIFAGYAALTPRQVEVLGYLAAGLHRDDIADRMCVTGAAIDEHLLNLRLFAGVKHTWQVLPFFCTLEVKTEYRQAVAVTRKADRAPKRRPAFNMSDPCGGIGGKQWHSQKKAK